LVTIEEEDFRTGKKVVHEATRRWWGRRPKGNDGTLQKKNREQPEETRSGKKGGPASCGLVDNRTLREPVPTMHSGSGTRLLIRFRKKTRKVYEWDPKARFEGGSKLAWEGEVISGVPFVKRASEATLQSRGPREELTRRAKQYDTQNPTTTFERKSPQTKKAQFLKSDHEGDTKSLADRGLRIPGRGALACRREMKKKTGNWGS